MMNGMNMNAFLGIGLIRSSFPPSMLMLVRYKFFSRRCFEVCVAFFNLGDLKTEVKYFYLLIDPFLLLAGLPS